MRFTPAPAPRFILSPFASVERRFDIDAAYAIVTRYVGTPVQQACAGEKRRDFIAAAAAFHGRAMFHYDMIRFR